MKGAKPMFEVYEGPKGSILHLSQNRTYNEIIGILLKFIHDFMHGQVLTNTSKQNKWKKSNQNKRKA